MKTWIKTNLSKITLALALTGATTGTIGLIIGSVAHNKTNGYQSFFDWDYKIYWGGLKQLYEKEKQMMFIKYHCILV